LIASWKASRMSTPIAPLGPDSVLMKPILTLSAACVDESGANASAQAVAMIADLILMECLPSE